MIDPGDLYGISLRNATSVAFMAVVYAAVGILYLILYARRRRARLGMKDLLEDR